MQEGDLGFSDALDRWITDPMIREERLTVYCVNKECHGYARHHEVVAHSEYGTTTWDPDSCPDCGEDLEEENPEPGP